MRTRFKALWQLTTYIFSQMKSHNLFNLAGSLAFTSLLAFVPLVTVIFAYVSQLPLVQDLAEDINHFLLTYFIPDVGADIETILNGFINNALKMQWWSFVFLVITALMLISTIDKAIHEIWRDAESRSALGSLLVYWLVLLLTPLTLAASIAVSSYVSTLSLWSEIPDPVGLRWSLVFPFLITTIGLMLLYKITPTAKVRLAHALISAIFTAFLFELSKRLFLLYIEYFPVQEAIFGALAAFPLILIWLFVTWLVILIGAELCHALGVKAG